MASSNNGDGLSPLPKLPTQLTIEDLNAIAANEATILSPSKVDEVSRRRKPQRKTTTITEVESDRDSVTQNSLIDINSSVANSVVSSTANTDINSEDSSKVIKMTAIKSSIQIFNQVSNKATKISKSSSHPSESSSRLSPRLNNNYNSERFPALLGISSKKFYSCEKVEPFFSPKYIKIRTLTDYTPSSLLNETNRYYIV